MSGEVSRARQRKAVSKAKSEKSNANGENKVNGSDIFKNGKTSKELKGSSKTSLLIRLIFYTLLSTFVVVATLVSIDYRSGFLKEAYENNIPQEVS